MDRGRESIENADNYDSRKEISKTTTLSPSSKRSRQDYESLSSGGRKNRKNMNENYRTIHPRGLRKRQENKGHQRKKTTISRGERNGGKKNTNELMAISRISNTITKRKARRRTRSSAINLEGNNNNKNIKYKGRVSGVPTIPKRVFKALHLLRHEKFLRAASRYLKPAGSGIEKSNTKMR